jgi:hypothetical protein
VGCSYIWCWPFFWNDGCCFSFIDWGIFKHFKMAIISDAFPLSFENLSKHSSVNVFTILTVNWSIQSCIASRKCKTTTCSRPDGTVFLKLSPMSAPANSKVHAHLWLHAGKIFIHGLLYSSLLNFRFPLLVYSLNNAICHNTISTRFTRKHLPFYFKK